MKTGLVGILAGLALATTAMAQEAKPAKIFESDAVMDVAIEAPWKAITRENREGQSWPGTFRYVAADGQPVRIPVTISQRGLTRKKVCDFPPLRLDFDQEAAKGTAFRGAGNLKLVTHCFDLARYNQYYIKEYLAYRIYNLVTPLSFRVQGLDVDYFDGPDDSRPTERFAFLIEDPDDVGKRNGLKKLDIEKVQPGMLDPVQTNRYVVFEYLIGNLDFEVLGGPGKYCCHNARLLQAEGGGLITPLPYDLDSSGFVDAHYAAPPANLRVRSVTDRLFRGFCSQTDSLPGVLQEFQALRPQITALVQQETRLDERNRKTALRYIDGFYDDVKDDKGIKRNLTGSCRG